MLPFNFKGPIPKFDPNAKTTTCTYSYSAKAKDMSKKNAVVFACDYVFEFLSVIERKDMDVIFANENSQTRDQIFSEIQKLTIRYHDSGTKLDLKENANPVLMQVSGHPLAVQLVDTIVSSVVGTMSAVATSCDEQVQASRNTLNFKDTNKFHSKGIMQLLNKQSIAAVPSQEDIAEFEILLTTLGTDDILKKFQQNPRFAGPKFKSKFLDLLVNYAKTQDAKTHDPSTFLDGEKGAKLRELLTIACDNRAFSYFGLRRGGPCLIALLELAAARGGFGSMANIASKINFRYAKVPDTIPVVGTMAHAFIMMQTAIFKQALQDKNLEALLQSIDIKPDQYRYARKAVIYDGTADICDYMSFCSYIRGIQDFEKEIGKPNSKSIILLVDTTDTLNGIRAAIQAAIDTERPLDGVRLDTLPAECFVEAVKLLDRAAKDHPAYFAHTRVFCTDAIDLKGLKAIEKLCADNGILRPVSYGIGSNVSNTKPFELNRTLSDANQIDTNLKNMFRLADQPKPAVDQKFRSVTEGNPYEKGQLPADLYAPNQGIVLRQLSKRYKNNVKDIREVQASLHFRPRDDSENFLVVAGTDIVIKFLQGFIYADEFIDTVKKCGVGFNDAQIAELYKIEGRARHLILDIRAVADGTEMLPGLPIATVKGRPEDVLLVESFFTSVVGGMSAVATATEQITRAARKYPDKNGKSPKFYYGGLDQQRIISPHTGYAAMIGGSSGSTGIAMQEDCVPTIIPGIDFDVYNKYNLEKKKKFKAVSIRFTGDIPELMKKLGQLTNDTVKQIQGDFTTVQIEEIIRTYRDTGKLLDKLEFIVAAPLAAALNPKGLVFKITGVELGFSEKANNAATAYQHVLKAAGSTGPKAKPNKKSSIPGLQPESLIIKDKEGTAIAVMIVDLHMVPDKYDINDPKSVLQFILNEAKHEINPQLFFDRNKSVEQVPFILEDQFTNASAEFMLRRSNATKTDSCRVPSTKAAASSLADAIIRQKDCYERRWRDLPVLMQGSLYAKSCELLREPVNDDYYMNQTIRAKM